MNFNYDFIVEKFVCEGINYNAAITPCLFGGLDGLDFTGAITGTIISEDFGTRHFMLEPWGGGEWVCTDGLLTEELAKNILSIYYSKLNEQFEFNQYRVEIDLQSPDQFDEAQQASDN